MTDGGAERLLIAIAERAAKDYRINLKIMHKTKSETRLAGAMSENKTIRKFLGNRIADCLDEEYDKNVSVDIQKTERKRLEKKYLSHNERQKAYYHLNKDVISNEVRLLRKKRAEMGICTRCGKNKAKQGSRWCETCIGKGYR